MTAMTKWMPINKMVLVRKDDDKSATAGGIILPDSSKIPVLTCRVLAIGPAVDPIECPIKDLYKVLVRPASCVPLAWGDDNKLFVVKADDILAYQEIAYHESDCTV